MKVNELMEGLSDEDRKHNEPYDKISNEKYQDLIERVTKVMGKPAKETENHSGAHRFTYWMSSDKKGEHVCVSTVNGHLSLFAVYKGSWYEQKASANPWAANGTSTVNGEAGVAEVLKKFRSAVKATIKKSKAGDYRSTSDQRTNSWGYKQGDEAKKAEEFLQKISSQVK